MNIVLYLTCFGIALLGMAFQTVLKMKSLQEKARVGNITFTPGSYFKNDYLSIIASLLAILIILACLDNIAHWKPAIMDYIKPLFAFVGYTGSDIASRLFSVVNRKINTIIDLKTNKADTGVENQIMLTDIPKTKIE